MRVQLRIELSARVVVINRKRQVSSRPILIGARLPYAAGCIRLGFLECLADRLAMRLDQPVVASYDRELSKPTSERRW